MSAFFDLWNTHGTPYDYSDDTLVDSDNTFNATGVQDVAKTAAGGSVTRSSPTAPAATWHNDWWQLAGGLTGRGRGPPIGSIPTRRTPSSPLDQRNTTALNAFAFYATASGGTPRIYGIGAMEAYVRLPGGQLVRSSTWPRSTRSTPARRWSSSCGTRATPARSRQTWRSSSQQPRRTLR